MNNPIPLTEEIAVYWPRLEKLLSEPTLILGNFHGFLETTQTARSSYSKICKLKNRSVIIKTIDMLAELTNAQHGRTSDFEKPSDPIGRAESVGKILLDIGFLRALCETA